MTRSWRSRTLAIVSLVLGTPALAAEPAAAPASATTQARQVHQNPAARPAPAGASGLDEATKAKVRKNPLLQRLSTVGGSIRFLNRSKGADRYLEGLMGRGAVPFALPTPRGLVQGFAARDGRRLWISSAMVRDDAALLRLGDLLPLLQIIGISDREVALGVRTLQVGSDIPPSYTVAVRPGLLWKHRAVLEAQRKSGRVLYSLTTGRVTVLGAHVLVEGPAGGLKVRLVSPAGDQVARIADLLVPRQCRDLEAALRTGNPKKLVAVARKKLKVPSMTQACAARYLSLVGGASAPRDLRRALEKERIARPFDVIEALVRVAPEPKKANLLAVLAMIRRAGTVGADAACHAMPLAWTNALLERDDLDEATRAVFTRCVWR